MPSIVLSDLLLLTHFILRQHYDMGAIINPILQMRKWKQREIKQLV